jgi:hypothetical protein
MRAEVYCRLQALAKLGVAGTSVTQVVERALEELCDKHGVASFTREEAILRRREEAARRRPKAERDDPEIISQHFTF